MSRSFDDLEPCQALTEIARDFHGRGWMAGTAGNLSARDRADPASFWITASGQAKGRLDSTDFLRMALADDQVLGLGRAGIKPSAETSIHRAIYRLFPAARVCLHVHTVDASLAAARGGGTQATDLPLPPLEMIKGLGIWEENPRVALPLFANWLDVPAIAAEIEARFTAAPPPVPALMIHQHGVTVWGASLQEAYNRVEIVEFLMSYLARRL
ncbi:MAG: methylthioribulose 1-phosphate dehydratase [Pseudomonadota bacterium]